MHACFDALMPMGRTNGGLPESPCDEAQVLRMMDRFDVSDALVFHTTSRDGDPNLGNAALDGLKSPRLHRIWAFDPAAALPETPAAFLRRALAGGARAIMVNPCMRRVRIDRSPRLIELGCLLEERRIPLLAVYWQWDAGQDIADWYQLADFCRLFPRLPVMAWEFRARANRPVLDALALTENLWIALSAIWQAQMIEAVCETFGPRLWFSLGLPHLDPAAFVGALNYADIDPADREQIAHGHLHRILREANYEYQ